MGRTLTISSLAAAVDHSIQRPFATLIPAASAFPRQRAEELTKELISLGCLEFCCVGPEAELLHDGIDAIIEDEGALDVVTTSFEDPSEASEYFLHAVATGQANLLALIRGHPELEALVHLSAP